MIALGDITKETDYGRGLWKRIMEKDYGKGTDKIFGKHCGRRMLCHTMAGLNHILYSRICRMKRNGS